MGKPQSVADSALASAEKDLSLAQQAVDEANIQELHTIVQRLVRERSQLAQGFNAVVESWSMLGGERGRAGDEAMQSLERVATQAIEFAREVVQALTHK